MSHNRRYVLNLIWMIVSGLALWSCIPPVCEHKITQHLEGQYPNGQALRAALVNARKALKDVGE
jgi:hypothetical protein